MKVDLIQVSCDAIKLITSLMPHLVLRSTWSTKSSYHAAAPATQCVSNVTRPRLYAFKVEPNSDRVTLVFVSAKGTNSIEDILTRAKSERAIRITGPSRDGYTAAS